MSLWSSALISRWQHVRWRLSLMLPLLFTQYASAEEVYEDRALSGWKLAVASVLVVGVSIWSFTL